MQNIKELRDSLMDNYEQTKSGQMEKGTCKELANTAGKIINTLRAELEFMAMTGVKKDIAFLRTGEEMVQIPQKQSTPQIEGATRNAN